nr:hypothetical protein [Amycolatopsis australiensis]
MGDLRGQAVVLGHRERPLEMHRCLGVPAEAPQDVAEFGERAALPVGVADPAGEFQAEPVLGQCRPQAARLGLDRPQVQRDHRTEEVVAVPARRPGRLQLRARPREVAQPEARHRVPGQVVDLPGPVAEGHVRPPRPCEQHLGPVVAAQVPVHDREFRARLRFAGPVARLGRRGEHRLAGFQPVFVVAAVQHQVRPQRPRRPPGVPGPAFRGGQGHRREQASPLGLEPRPGFLAAAEREVVDGGRPHARVSGQQPVRSRGGRAHVEVQDAGGRFPREPLLGAQQLARVLGQQVVQPEPVAGQLAHQVVVDQPIDENPRAARGERGGRADREVVAGVQAQQPEQLPRLLVQRAVGHVQQGTQAPAARGDLVEPVAAAGDPRDEVAGPAGSAAGPRPGSAPAAGARTRR